MRSRHSLAVLALLLLALPGCTTAQLEDGLAGLKDAPVTPRPSATRPPVRPVAAPGGSSTVVLVATLRGDTRVLATPGGSLLAVQDELTDEGSQQRLLVLDDRGEWLRIALPGRPNGRTGWVRAGDVDLAATDWRVQVSLRKRRLTVRRGGLVYGTHVVAVGAPGTPTPTGVFFVTDLLAPPDPAGAYGPYAFGISAYSDVVTSFGGGRGQIGLHGTNDQATLGQPVSKGCLRLDNETIRVLAAQLPLGTPFEITA